MDIQKRKKIQVFILFWNNNQKNTNQWEQIKDMKNVNPEANKETLGRISLYCVCDCSLFWCRKCKNSLYMHPLQLPEEFYEIY